MNILLWILQIVLALHTAIGAVWKFSHMAEQTMPSLKAIASGPWMALAVAELLCALCLVLAGFFKPTAVLVPSAAIFVALVMLMFCAVHLASGATQFGPLVYWLVVAALCSFVAYGRLVLRPFS